VYIFTSDLPVKKLVCQKIDRNVRFSFRHWTTSAAVSFLCFQLAAGQFTVINVALEPLTVAISTNLSALQTEANAALQQVQATENAALQDITSEIQAANNTVQQYAADIGATSQQAQECLSNETQTLTTIANNARK
jgi:hypothetical protein